MPPLEPLFLQSESLDWALAHIRRYGDTDLFPIPFEYEAHAAIWPAVREFLTGVDVANSETAANWKMMVPKHSAGFRGATQLSPFDALLYSALIYENSGQIEAFRRPKKERIACAYRIEPTPEGVFFGKDTGWNDFHAASDEMSSEENCTHVVCADISDFYNQVSHHRIQGALEQAGIDDNRTRVIERFLGNINARHHSRGIPVEPAVSILLAEACLADVDNVLRQQCRHTRYVDDFRIFCQSEAQAVQALHDLSEYLHTAHRLSLQTAKTFILSKEKFRAEELSDPETEERRAKEAGIVERIKELHVGEYGEWQEVEEEEIKKEEFKIAAEVLQNLFARVVKSRILPLGPARYLLRRAVAIRSRAIFRDLLDNLEKFLPVIREVVLYLTKVQNDKNRHLIGDYLVRLLRESPYGTLPFIQYWTLSVFHRVPASAPEETVFALAQQTHPAIRDRMLALTAAAYCRAEWVRGKKETWANTSPLAQRAIIWSSFALPHEERNHWLQPIRNNADPATRFLADGVFAMGLK
jgi:hypothetical protein